MATEVTNDDMMDLKLDDLLPAADKKLPKHLEAVLPSGRVEIKRHGVTVDMVNSLEIAKRNHPTDQGYEIYSYTGDKKCAVSPVRATTVPGNRMRRRT